MTLTRRQLAIVLAVLLWVGCIVFGLSKGFAQPSEGDIQHAGGGEYVTGVVQSLEQIPSAEFKKRYPDYQPLSPDESIEKVQVTITGGVYAGETVTVENYLTGQQGYNIPLEPGARVILQMDYWPDQPEPEFHIVDRERFPVFLLLIGLYMLALLVSGGYFGLKSFLLGAGVLWALRSALFPAAFSGIPVFWGTVIFVLGLLLGGVYLLWGTDRLGRVVFWGTLDAMAAGGLFVVLASIIAPLRGFVSEGMIYFQMAYPAISPLEIYFSGWLLMATGIAFHLAHAMASTIRLLPEKPSFSEAMALGNRLLGSYHLALILLAVGLLLPNFFLWREEDIYRFMNLESVISYAVWLFALLLTAILTVPLTARAALKLL